MITAIDVRARERRRFTRRPVAAACKVRDASGYFPGRTADLSDGGCRFVTCRERPFCAGQELRLGLAAHLGEVLQERAMRPAQVRRVRQLADGRQEVAVEFEAAKTPAETLPQAA